MKKYIEMILRKIGVSMLALLIVMTTYFSNSGGSLFLKTKKVQADTGETTLAMSQAMSRNKIPAIGRAASEGLWAMTAGGHRVFCLNSGKTMCSGDTLKYKTVNAATYEKKGIAKALQWYFMKSKEYKGTGTDTGIYLGLQTWSKQTEYRVSSWKECPERIFTERCKEVL